MIYSVVLLVGIVVGYALCYFAPTKTKVIPAPEENTIMVKRSKPSLRSPLQTNKVAYEQYKTKDTGLYAPVKPRANRKDEIEVSR